MEAQHHATLSAHFLLAVGIGQEGEQAAIGPGRRLDHVRHHVLLALLIEIGERLAAELRVLLQVEVGPVGDALELAPADGELVLDVDRPLGVVSELVLLVLTDAKILPPHAVPLVPGEPRLDPALVPDLVGRPPVDRLQRIDEELDLHLLELAGPEDEIAGRDLVAKGLADLGDPKRQLPPCRLLDVLEVHEDRLRRLRPEPRDGRGVLDRTHERLEHEVELTRIRELALAAVRAGHAGEVELLRAPGGRELVALRQVVQAETLPAVAALDERVREVLDVARGFPDTRVHEDRAIEADDVLAELDHRAPPRPLHIVL